MIQGTERGWIERLSESESGTQSSAGRGRAKHPGTSDVLDFKCFSVNDMP